MKALCASCYWGVVPGGAVRSVDRMDGQPAALLDGFRWPVAVTQPIAASREAVWAAISMPGNLELCHPFCAQNPVTVWPGPGSRDEVHYLSGWVYERTFTRWIEGVGYDLEIGGRGEPTSDVSWRIDAVGPRDSTLTITVYPHLLQNLPAPVRWFPHAAYLRPLLKRYLSSVVRGFEWYVTQHQPVAHNQFGSHPWFSASRRTG